jgi:cytochrome c-type biogenesis protein CcmH
VIYLFALLTLVVIASVIWFIAAPLLRTNNLPLTKDYYQLVALRDRLLSQLNELDLDERDASMDSDTARDERLRMQAELADVLKRLAQEKPAVGGKPPARRSATRQRWAAVLAISLLIPLFSVAVYLFNVTVRPTQLADVATQSAPSGMPDPRQMVARLEKRLQQNPNDFPGWLMLGRSYSVMSRLEEAKLAYLQAYRLMPKDYRPDGPDSFWFLGVAAYTEGHYERALVFWKQFLAQLPPDSEPAAQLRRVIADLEKKMKR